MQADENTGPPSALTEGIALRKARRLEEAAARFRQVLEADPECTPALRHLAETLGRLGQPARALDCYDALIERLPGDGRSLRLRAACLVQLEQPLAAVAGLVDALRAGGEQDAKTIEALETLLYRTDLRLALALEPSLRQRDGLFDAVGLRLLGDTCLRINRTTEAAGCFRAALALAPDCCASMTGLAGVLALRDEQDQSRDWLQRALACDPGQLSALSSLGDWLMDAQQPAAALALFERGAEAAPRSRPMALLRAQALRELGRIEEAQRWFRVAWGVDSGTCAGIDEVHGAGLRAAWVNQALVLPVSHGSVPRAVRGGVLAPRCAPEYLYQQRVVPADGPTNNTLLTPADDPGDAVERLAGQHLYAGILLGHFVSESSHRLWAYQVHRQDIDRVLVLPCAERKTKCRPRKYADLSPFQRQTFELFGVPEARISVVSAPTRVEKLLVPEQASLLGGALAPPSSYLDFLGDNAERFFADYKPRRSSYPERLYVGRFHLLHQGGIAGEGYLERLLQAEGFMPFRPEEHDLFEQLTHYRQARLCLFSEGSALHGLELLGRLDRRPTIAVLGRRPLNERQWRRIVLPRTPNYAFCAPVMILSALAYNPIINKPVDWNALSVIHELDRLLGFLRERLGVRLTAFDRDRFNVEEAADVARHLLHTKTNAANPEWGQQALARFRQRIAAVSDNPYLR